MQVKAKLSANEGNDAMVHMSNAIEKIKVSSDNGKIIKTIDEIFSDKPSLSMQPLKLHGRVKQVKGLPLWQRKSKSGYKSAEAAKNMPI